LSRILLNRSQMRGVCGSSSSCGCESIYSSGDRGQYDGDGAAAVFRATVGQDAIQRKPVLFEEGKGAIVQEIGSRDRRLLGVELGEADLRVRVDESLSIDPTNAFERAEVGGCLARHSNPASRPRILTIS
jgi:hypothetical protein